MYIRRYRLLLSMLIIVIPLSMVFARCHNEEDKISCCEGMGGVSYCDALAGRVVCGNGEYSACYCTRHAVMDLQKITGCCVWQGGVMKTDPFGLVICRDGGTSEVCSQTPVTQVTSSW